MYILELKKWNGKEYHKNRQLQLAGYLDQYRLSPYLNAAILYISLINKQGQLSSTSQL